MSTHRLRALVLDRSHRVLLSDQGPLEAVVDGAAPRLASLDAALRERHGLRLPAPIGSRGDDGAPPSDFAFVVDSRETGTPSGLRWIRLPQAITTTPEADWCWSFYVEGLLGGWAPPTRALDVFAFGTGIEMPAQLAHLVVCGHKRGTASWLRATEHEGLTVPTPGLVSIVTDGFGLPRCAIQTEQVQHVPFREVDATFAASEGEGDRSLEDWRQSHRAYFVAEAESLGLSWDESEVILLESFGLLHVFGR
jgi:uncharacterized protein YhfF